MSFERLMVVVVVVVVVAAAAAAAVVDAGIESQAQTSVQLRLT